MIYGWKSDDPRVTRLSQVGDVLSYQSYQYELTKTVAVRAMRRRAPGVETGEHLCDHLCGHRFEVSITLRGDPDSTSGLIFDRDRLDRILRLSLVEPLDGALLDELFPNPTGAGLARAIYLRLQPVFPPAMLTRVRIRETNSRHFEFPPDD